jgi:hypothetical protein
MARPRKENTETQTDIMTETIQKVESAKLAIEDMPLNTLRDYRLYNEEARKMNKKLGVARYKIKQCPIELHPKQRIVFSRNDQPSNPLQVYVSDHLIHFDQTLIPGKEYDLPECIIHYLAEKGTPVWKWFDNPDGSKETRKSHMEPRFSLRSKFAHQG